MQLSTLPPSTDKTPVSPQVFPEQSSHLSANCHDARPLMKKKQQQYQNQLMIQDAERVHNLISELQEKEKQQRRALEQNTKRRLKREIVQYSKKAIHNFDEEWSSTFTKTIKGLEEVQQYLAQQQEQQITQAVVEIEKAKEGKGLENIKFSPQVLIMEDQLKRLIKSQRYQEAYVVRNRLEQTKKSEMKNFISQSVDRSRRSLQKLKKEQEKERELVGERLSAVYLKQKSRYQKEYEQLTKNIKTYEVDLTKIESKVKRVERGKAASSRIRTESLGNVPKVDFRFEVESAEKKDNPKREPQTAEI